MKHGAGLTIKQNKHMLRASSQEGGITEKNFLYLNKVDV